MSVGKATQQKRAAKNIRDNHTQSILKESMAQRNVRVNLREKPYALTYKDSKPKLKNCPFCNGNNIHIETDDDLGSYICCYDCLASFFQQEACCPEDNIKAWNKRVKL